MDNWYIYDWRAKIYQLLHFFDKLLHPDLLVQMFLNQQEQLELLTGEVRTLNEKMQLMMEQIILGNKKRFGRSSEQMIDAHQIRFMEVDGNIVFFNEAEAVCDLEAPEPDDLEVKPARQVKTKGKKEQDMEGLPVNRINHVIQADETPCLVNRDGRKAGSKSYMWVYRTGFMYNKKPIILYEYQLTRNASHPRAFLKDYSGICVTDNNASERAIRGFCIGKKNWQMIDTINGAKTSAMIYSIAETAKANNLKPYEYFEYLLEEIPKHMDDMDRSFLDRLLPWSPELPEHIRKTK